MSGLRAATDMTKTKRGARMMDDHPDLRDLGGPIPYVEVRPHRDQLYKAVAGLINTVTLVGFVASIPLIVMLFRAAF